MGQPMKLPNHSIQQTRGSRSARAVLFARWRLTPAADAARSGNMRTPAPNLRKRIALAVISFVAVGALSWPCLHGASEPSVELTFVGWMDNDPQTTYARFVIRNVGGRAINPQSLVVEKLNAKFENPSYRRSGSGFIGSGQAETVTVLAPLEDGPWRLHLSFGVAGLRHSTASWYAALFYNTRI